MSENQLPKLTFKWNKPVIVEFLYDPVSAKEIHGEYQGKKTLSFFHTVMVDAEKFVFFATEKQQKEIVGAGLEAHVKYMIVKEEIDGSKSYNFWIYDGEGKVKLNGRANTNTTIQKKVDEVEELFGAEKKTPVNATKASTNKDKMTMDMCFKEACAFNRKGDGSGYLELDSIKADTRDLYKAFNELMSE